MFLLFGLLAIKRQNVKVIGSNFNRIISFYKLKSVCTYNEKIGSKNGDRIAITDCADFSFIKGVYNGVKNSGIVSSVNGGAISLSSVTTATINKSTFVGNYGDNGVVYFESVSTVIMSLNGFINCTAKYGGCLYFKKCNGEGTIIENNFSSSSTSHTIPGDSSDGGSIYVTESPLNIQINESNFEDSESKKSNGGALYFNGPSVVTLFNDHYTNCKADYGGTMYFKNIVTKIHLDQCYFSNSHGLRAKDGGAIYCNSAPVFILENSEFEDCDANTGGCLYLFDISSKIEIIANFQNIVGNFVGGTIFISTSKSLSPTILLNKSSITNSSTPNLGGDGGSIYITTKSEVTVEQSIIRDSTSIYGSGGALYMNGLTKLIINLCKFFDCCAEEYGGAIQLLKPSDILITNNEFKNCAMSSNKTNTETRIGGCMNIEAFQPIELKNNIFNDCYSYHFGGALCFIGSNNLVFTRNTFRNCSTLDDYGGALYISGSEGIRSLGNSFINCHSKLYGGALYFASITQASYMTRFSDDKFSGCYSAGYGGAISVENCKDLTITMNGVKFSKCYNSGTSNGGVIYMVTVDKISFDGIECNESYSSSGFGGFIYTIEIQTGIDLKNSLFNDCSANSGGVFYFDYYTSASPKIINIDVFNCDFNSCICKTDKGGVFYIERYVNVIYIKASKFHKCIAKNSGSAIYYHYTYVSTPDEITIGISDNNFEDCKSETYGSLVIESYRVDNAIFRNNIFKNCSTTNSDSTGGALMALINSFGNFQFTNCSFLSCSAPLKYGALGFKIGITKENSSLVRISGCTFENCSAIEASCIGIKVPQVGIKSITKLIIEGNKEQNSAFRLLKGTDKYAIVTDVSEVQMSNANFDQVEIGALQSIKLATLKKCNFNDCLSSNSIINCTSLTRLEMHEMTFSHCTNCLLINSTGTSNISFLTIKDSNTIPSSIILKETNEPFSSIIDSNTIIINNLDLLNNIEQIKLNVGTNLKIEKGSFDGSSKAISVTGLKTAELYATTLNVKDSLMFDVNGIEKTLIRNCIVSYNLLDKVKKKIIVTTSPTYEVTECHFSTNNVTPIEFAKDTTSGLINNSIFDGENSTIIVGSSLTVNNSEFRSNGKSFCIVNPSGSIKLGNTYCFYNKVLSQAIEDSAGSKVSAGGTVISEFDENHNVCKAIPTPSEFIYTSEPIESSYLMETMIEATTKEINEKMTEQKDLKSNIETENNEGTSILLDKATEIQQDATESKSQLKETEAKDVHYSSEHIDLIIYTSTKNDENFVTPKHDKNPSSNEENVETTIINIVKQESSTDLHIENIVQTSGQLTDYSDVMPTQVKQPDISKGAPINVATSIKVTKVPEEDPIIATTDRTEHKTVPIPVKVTTQEKIPEPESLKITPLAKTPEPEPIKNTTLTKEQKDPVKAAATTNEPVKIDTPTNEPTIIISPTKNKDEKFKPVNDDDEANAANKNNSSNTGVIAGATIAAIVVVIIVVIAIYFIACRKKSKHDRPSFNENETEFETIENSSSLVPMDLRTSYSTQEMPTSTLTNANFVQEDDFLDFDESD